MALVQIDATAKNAERAFTLIRSRLCTLFELFEQVGVTEVNLNGPNDVWITRNGLREAAPPITISELTAFSAVRELASSMGQESTPGTTSAIVDAKMPGYRFSAVLAPIASNGTILSIRKHSPRVLSLEDYVKAGQFDQSISEYLTSRVRDGSNIIIGGGTDTGKTTFLNALSREIPDNERVGSIEDTRELALKVRDWFPFETNAQKGVTATMMVKASMRHSPHRIICGELRDGVAADFIELTNTGHDGCMATVHCSTAYSALGRLEELCLKGNSDWPLLAIQRNIGRSIDLVLHFKKFDGERKLSEIVEVNGYNPSTDNYRTKQIFTHQTESTP